MDRNTFAEQLYATSIPSNMPPDEQNNKLRVLQDIAHDIMPKSLFRFRECSERHIDAFDKDELWVSTADCMNDGFDTRIYVDQTEVMKQINGLISNCNDIKQLFNNIPDLSNFPPEFSQVKERALKLDEDEIKRKRSELFLWIKNDSANALLQIPAIGQKTTKICCFSESIYSPTMWGVYASNESGFALEYDFSTKPYAQSPTLEYTRDCSLFPVIYSEKRFQVPVEYITFLLQYRLINTALIKSGMNNSYPEFARWFLSTGVCPDNLMVTKISLHKSDEWKRESEWRLFCTSNDMIFQNEKHGCCIKKPKAIYLGRRISPINEKILRKLAEDKAIPVYKMAMDDRSPTYDLVVG